MSHGVPFAPRPVMENGRVLVASNDVAQIRLLSYVIRRDGRLTPHVVATNDLTEALRSVSPHVVVLDVDATTSADVLPTTAPRMRPPILVLTRARGAPERIRWLELGADDVLTYPVQPDEFYARMYALMRRRFNFDAYEGPVVRAGELSLDLVGRTLHVGTHAIRLTLIEQGILQVLIANADCVVSRDELLQHVWGVDYFPESNVIDVHIRQIRRRLLEIAGSDGLIETVPGRGYRLRR